MTERPPALRAVVPGPDALSFRAELLSDAATMSYNLPWGDAIGFPAAHRADWYRKWVAPGDPQHYYAYLVAAGLGPVGEIAWHLRPEDGLWLCDVLVHARFRGRGFGGAGLELLCAEAVSRGLPALHDEIALGSSAALALFLAHGFTEVSRDAEAVRVRRLL